MNDATDDFVMLNFMSFALQLPHRGWAVPRRLHLTIIAVDRGRSSREEQADFWTYSDVEFDSTLLK